MTTVFVPDTVIEESDVERLATMRTELKHPTAGPDDGTGRDWHQYFVDLKAPYRAALAEADDEASDDEDTEPEMEIEVLQWMKEVDPTALNSRAKAPQVAKRLLAQGWNVRVGQSVALKPAVLYVKDSPEGADPAKAHLKGDVRTGAHELTTTCVVASKRAGNGEIGLAMEATWTSKGGFRVAITADPILGREIRVNYTGPREQNAIEYEDRIEPPMGLGEWLDIVAPRPGAKPKKKDQPVEEGVWNG